VQNLRQLASSSDETERGDEGVRVGLELRLLASKDDRHGRPLSAAGAEFHDGDRLMIRLSNPNRFPLDVTLLYINGGLGIDSLFPEAGEINRLDPREVRPLRLRMTSRTMGLEHLVVLAVKGTGGPPVDFSSLSQPTLEAARGAERTRGGPGALASPLGRLLQQALFAGGGTRSAGREELEEYRLELVSWKVLAGRRPGAR
jgi:hypothetical protein